MDVPSDVPQFEHLKWLNANDQRVLCRAECAAALAEERKLVAEIRAAVDAHVSAIEHCRAASESDLDWFTLDVQDCHSRRALILRDTLAALEADTPPAPEDAEAADGIRGRIYAGYAHTAQTTLKVASGLQENERVQRLATTGQAAAASAAASARDALGAFASRLSRSGRTPPASAAASPAAAAACDPSVEAPAAPLLAPETAAAGGPCATGGDAATAAPAASAVS